MSWAEVKKINSNLSSPINEQFLALFPQLRFFYETATFKVPFDIGLTIRACGAGGAGNSSGYGGAGGGYSKDYRQYKKGDIISMTFAAGTVTISCQPRDLSMAVGKGANGGTTGGTATGGNIRNIVGAGRNQSSPEGCAGGASSSGAGLTGGFSGSRGTSGQKGGDGGFFGGDGGAGSAGGNSAHGIGGNGGDGYSVTSSLTTANGGNGGNGYIMGGNGGNGSTTSNYPGNGGNGGNSQIGKGGKGGNAGDTSRSAGIDGQSGGVYNGALPRPGNCGGGGAGYSSGTNLSSIPGPACVIIQFGEGEDF